MSQGFFEPLINDNVHHWGDGRSPWSAPRVKAIRGSAQSVANIATAMFLDHDLHVCAISPISIALLPNYELAIITVIVQERTNPNEAEP
jgi:hypothetical protein